MSWHKIRIIGASGSGKSYAAEKLSKLLHIPWFEMDTFLNWHPDDVDYTRRLPVYERDALLRKVLAKNKWILEGSMTKDWTKPTFEQADLIVLLKPTKFRRILNVFRRYFARWDDPHETLKGQCELIGITWKWDKKLKRLKPYKSKTQTFRKADHFLVWAEKNLER